MKTAIIEDGKVIVMTCMDKQADRGFYEVRLINGLDNLTCCRWIADKDIKIEES